jgi:hypothetical protein
MLILDNRWETVPLNWWSWPFGELIAQYGTVVSADQCRSLRLLQSFRLPRF